jgi:hypothetical protein
MLCQKLWISLFARRVAGIIFLAILATCLPLAAQTNPLETVDWFERDIGEGVIWRQYEFDSLFGARQHITYIEADLDHSNVEVVLPYLPTGIQRTSTLVPAQFSDAIAAVNGTYFNTTDVGHNTYLRIDNVEIPHKPRTKGEWGHHGALARDASDNWGIIEMPTTGGEWDDNNTHPDIMANGPMLVWGGVYANAYSGTHCTGRHPRTAVGITSDNRIILLTADGRTDRGAGLTCEETGQVLIWLDVVEAVNMDGGGTTTAWIKGEPNSGIVNYPSDGTGERGTPNAIAIISPPAPPAEWDAQLLGVNYVDVVEPNETQTITLTYKNIGTQTWSQTDTRLVTSRPDGRESDLYEFGWVSESQPALMSPATVAPDETATFSFQITAPDVTSAELILEHFMLTQEGVGRIGPSDSRARLKIAVVPAIPEGESFLVECRSGGLNYTAYSDVGFYDSSATCNALGATSGIGSRWASTYFSVVGLKTATWRPNFPQSGEYHISVAWPDAGSNRKNPITYHVDHDGGRDTILINQESQGDTWYPLGIFSFSEGLSDNGRIQMTNENVDVSGNFWAGPIRFVYLDPSTVQGWVDY